MELDVNPSTRRVPKNFTIQEHNIAMIGELSAAYSTNASRIVDALIQQFGPTLLKNAPATRTAQK
jgi:hypothetical protein